MTWSDLGPLRLIYVPPEPDTFINGVYGNEWRISTINYLRGKRWYVRIPLPATSQFADARYLFENALDTLVYMIDNNVECL